MTQAEKMARRYGSEMCTIPDRFGVEALTLKLIHRVAERTREECVKKAMQIHYIPGGWDKAILNACWEDEEVWNGIGQIGGGELKEW